MFVASKILNLLINPALWTTVFLIIAWFSRSAYTRRRWLGIGLVCFLFFSNPYIIQRLVQAYQYPPAPMLPNERYEAGVLLGGVMNWDNKLSYPYFNRSSDRFIQTLRLYKAGHIKKIIVSGGNASISGKGVREADYLEQSLLQMGVPGKDIIVERNARNTVENAGFTHRISDSLNTRSALVVITSSWHMPRAVQIFKREGIQIRPFACDYHVPPANTSFTPDLLLPSGASMNTWTMLIKEWIGRAAIGLQRN